MHSQIISKVHFPQQLFRFHSVGTATVQSNTKVAGLVTLTVSRSSIPTSDLRESCCFNRHWNVLAIQLSCSDSVLISSPVAAERKMNVS